ncbi:YtxH domain-containing protein [Pedobacter sp. GR22-6]|uniref:YtxH domain-containing protein n=1 Tax=Pedobacter sp. GR22-6 TaxID=3127957 RepID=UPI00307D03F6
MGFIKNAIVGIAIYEAIKYMTKKDALGYSKFDELKEKAPEWIEKTKAAVEDIKQGQLPQV